MGRKPVLPIEKEMLDDTTPDVWENDVEKYAEELVKVKKDLYDRAHRNIKTAQSQQKRDYANKHHHKRVRLTRIINYEVNRLSIMHQELQVGTLVLLRNSAKDGRKGDKLAKRWLGPYIIEECVGKGVYRLSNHATGRILRKVYNGSR